MEIYRFGLFELDVERSELRRGGLRLPLQDQPLALLRLLLERAGDVVTRDEIRQTLWPPDLHLEFDNSLNAAVSRLREVLGDMASNPRFVATVPRRGYRFIAPVEVLAAASSADPSLADPSLADPSLADPSAATTLDGGSRDEPPSSLAVDRSNRWLWVGMGILGLVLMSVVAARRSVPPVEVEGVGVEKVEDLEASFPKADVKDHVDAPLRLAVLPITTFSSQPDQDFIGDGLTEELIGRLGTLQPSRLAVIARTSVMPYKGADVGVQEIGADLSVDYLLEGSLRRQQDAVLITVRLIRVVDQTQLWQRQFERRLIDFFDLQREISEEVAESLTLELLEDPTKVVWRNETSHPEAYELYLKGQYLLDQRTHEGFEQARTAFQQAAILDPSFASAQLGIAQSWILAGIFDAVLPQEAKQHASVAIDELLRLDAGHYAGLLGRAYLRFVFEWRWQDAEADFLKALQVAPNFSEAHQAYAEFLLSQGRFDEALASLQRALELDPLSRVLRAEQCWHLFYARRFDAAIERCEATLEMDREFLHAQDNLKWVLTRAGREDEAIEAFLRLLVLEGESTSTLSHYRWVAESRGLQGMLEQNIDYRLASAARDVESVVPYDMALDAAAAGRRELAIEWLQRSFERQETDLVFLGVDPRFDSLRQEPRFQALLEKWKIPHLDRRLDL